MHERRVATKFLVVAALGVVVGRAAIAQATPAVPTLEWAPCGDEYPGAECAVARVPLDYDEPAGRKTGVALARVSATDPAHRVGTLFFNPGGPGGSGVDSVLGGVGEFFGSLLDGRFDIVGFDPRGVGSSEPLRCFENEAALDDYLASMPVFPYLSEQEEPFFDVARELSGRCEGQRIRSHMSTADVVRDLDLLRRAVGDAELTYVGASYGSYLGNTYANLFPDRVRALVIDGVLDPRLWSSGLQIVSDRVATAEEFEEFLRLCDEAGPACPLTGAEGAAARYEELAAALLEQPLELPDGFYSYDFLVADTTSAMYAPESWGGPEGFAALFDELAELASGATGDAEVASVLRQGLVERWSHTASEAVPYDNSFEAYFGNQCADTEYPSALADFVNVADFAASGSIFGPYWWWYNASCADWPVAEDRYTGPWTASTSAPVLVIGNYFDGVTDYAGAVASSELLPNSRLLSYAGWGHTAIGRSDCVTEHTRRYLLDGTLPPTGSVCPANANPFIPSEPQSAQARAQTQLLARPPAWLSMPSLDARRPGSRTQR